MNLRRTFILVLPFLLAPATTIVAQKHYAPGDQVIRGNRLISVKSDPGRQLHRAEHRFVARKITVDAMMEEPDWTCSRIRAGTGNSDSITRLRLKPWQPKKLYHLAGESYPATIDLAPIGENPLTGTNGTCLEFGEYVIRNFQSQGIYHARSGQLSLVRSLVPVPEVESSVFNGLDKANSWSAAGRGGCLNRSPSGLRFRPFRSCSPRHLRAIPTS